MTIKFLTRKLTEDTPVVIKDKKTNEVLFEGRAIEATFGNEVKDWDFSKEHIIYI